MSKTIFKRVPPKELPISELNLFQPCINPDRPTWVYWVCDWNYGTEEVCVIGLDSRDGEAASDAFPFATKVHPIYVEIAIFDPCVSTTPDSGD